MSVVWLRALRSTYRKQTAVSFVITAGIVEAAIGGLGAQWSLMMFGSGTVGVAIALYWWQQRQRVPKRPVPIYALPSRSSSPSLPLLSLPKQPPPSGKR